MMSVCKLLTTRHLTANSTKNSMQSSINLLLANKPQRNKKQIFIFTKIVIYSFNLFTF